MIASPVNTVIVKIDTKYIADLTNMIRMASLNAGSQINPADYVNVVGTVVSVPKQISKRHDYRGFACDDIRVGDKAIFSYTVVFTFNEAEDGNAVFRNLFTYKAEEYWKVDIQQLYGLIRGEQIIMVNGYCMVEEISEPSMIVLPASMEKKVRATTATLTQIGNNLKGEHKIMAERGDTIHFNPNKVTRYQIKGKKFGIIKQKDIGAIEVAPYNYLSAAK